MKDYYQIDLDEFIKNNPDLHYQARKEAGLHSEAIGITIPEFVDIKMKEAHSKSLLSQGIQDPFEFCVDKHEPNTELALKIINERRQKINDFHGIDDL
ncbi:DUF6388 family protein [Leclercia adecarboxylata]|uniref:DUF6388 family protein n=1 Tax=Leclercia adecarboxylata TaxID=83655 RepID=UPI0022DEC7B9|nr:hypothetical protein [Leclercia adecarboxylata]